MDQVIEEHEQDTAEAGRVTTLELFSDLVFAFAITQLTTVLFNDRTWVGVGHALLLFGMLWWMYGGYIWLTNAVRPDRPLRKLLLLGAMAGFLMMGLATPHAFQGDGVVFGMGYLLVVLIHTGLFTQAATASTVAGIVRVAPFNLASALLLIVAGVLSGTAETALWVVALAIQVLSPLVTRTEGFRIEPGHFVERYGLLVLIVLGESIVAVGAGARNRPLDAAVVVTSLLGLALTAALWWIYFGGDQAQAEAVLQATPAERRPVRALLAFFYAQIPMLLGVVAIAAAVRTALPHPTSAMMQGQVWLLAGGATSFLAGDLWFRATLGIPRGIWRTVAAPVLLATAAVGLTFSAIAQLAALAGVLIASLAAESNKGHRPEHGGKAA
jgi:low temperature requirement protein LtrA